ncbi:TetR/AcrR family transcriptional regulator [Herbiconiux sp. CPCC 205716]|uniref:TetR/AcrR family transcriptional regulator n=1 Tax=Herbiconiux gentiana TaxID=2970912 RepID=A0ABT2GKL5_9MICO|nr:TetR/AcrR family transcriptional regulator [Herbiconiux gentiana]MCS5715459.1 TetR/AcrR family transcriptional regulator [Herbiconiux gentiana]
MSNESSPAAVSEPRTAVRTRIVEVAAGLLGDGGAAALTTRRVADAAGVQAPTIYRLFGDKDGLVDAVAEHVLGRFVAGKAALPAGTDPVEALRDGWRRQIDFSLGNPELHRLLAEPGRSGRTAALDAGLDVLRTRIRGLAAAGLLRVDEGQALGIIRAAATGTVQQLLDAPPGERDPGLAEAMLDAVLGRILVPGPDAAAPAPARTAPRLDGPRAAAIAVLAQLDDLPALTAAERQLLHEWLTRAVAARPSS